MDVLRVQLSKLANGSQVSPMRRCVWERKCVGISHDAQGPGPVRPHRARRTRREGLQHRGRPTN
eukprot:12895591-Prorocentrum_lima.AAC.1